MRYRLTRAADLAKASYRGKAEPVISHQWKASYSEWQHPDRHDDVEAQLLTDNTLLIVGSTSIGDYANFNLRRWRLLKPRLKIARISGAPNWHQGFLAYAKFVQDWLVDQNVRPSFVIGHSLGAAAAQILSAAYKVPAIGFAAPRVVKSQTPGALAPTCFSVNRTDDGVTRQPLFFKHIGHVRGLRPNAPNEGIDHNMDHYVQIVDEGLASGRLPQSWG